MKIVCLILAVLSLGCTTNEPKEIIKIEPFDVQIRYQDGTADTAYGITKVLHGDMGDNRFRLFRDGKAVGSALTESNSNPAISVIPIN